MSTGSDQGPIGAGVLQVTFLKWYLLRLRAKEHTKEAKRLEDEAAGIERVIADYCQRQDLDSFRVLNGPTARVTYKSKVWTVKERREEALQWLREHGFGHVIHEDWSSMNAAINDAMKAADERREAFELPDCFKHEVECRISPTSWQYDADKIESILKNEAQKKGAA